MADVVVPAAGMVVVVGAAWERVDTLSCLALEALWRSARPIAGLVVALTPLAHRSISPRR